MLRNAALTSLVLAASLARAGLSNMRATIPGSIHQCASSNVFFFDTNDSGSKTLLFVSPEDATNLGPGQLTLSSVLGSITPLQKIDGINSADAAEFDFTVDLAENVAFSTLGFLSDGIGKNMNLDRTVMQPLPDAPNCLAAGNKNAAAAAADAQVASSSSSSVAPVVAASSSSSAAPSSSTTPASAPPTTPSVKATAASASSTEYASRFVTSTKPKATSSAASVATSAAAISASLSLPPAASSSANATATATSGNATAPAAAAAATSPVVVQAKFLLTSFIEISNDKTSDGTVSSSVIKGGQVVGAVNGTILPIGNVLYAPNSTAVLPSNSSSSSISAANATAQAQTMLLSTSYTFTTEQGESVFVMAQTPLAQNFTTETLLMDFQSSESNSTLFSNITVLGKAETINATMFRIDAYYLNDASA